MSLWKPRFTRLCFIAFCEKSSFNLILGNVESESTLQWLASTSVARKNINISTEEAKNFYSFIFQFCFVFHQSHLTLSLPSESSFTNTAPSSSAVCSISVLTSWFVGFPKNNIKIGDRKPIAHKMDIVM